MHAWLYRQKAIGPALRDWDQRRAIAFRTKVLAISMMAISLAVIWLRVEILAVQLSVTALLILVAIFIATRPQN